jgi:hypothetical protein
MKLAIIQGNHSAAATMRAGIVSGFNFLARTGGEVMSAAGFDQTGLLWTPERDSHWARGTTLLNIIDAYNASVNATSPLLAWYASRLPTEGFETVWPTDLCHSNFIGLLLRQAAAQDGVVWRPSVL